MRTNTDIGLVTTQFNCSELILYNFKSRLTKTSHASMHLHVALNTRLRVFGAMSRQDSGVGPMSHCLIMPDQEEPICYLERFDARSRVIEVSTTCKQPGEREILDTLRAKIQSSNRHIHMIMLSLTNAIHHNIEQTIGVACIYRVGWLLTQGKVQILNAGRKVVDSRVSMVDSVLWILQVRRRQQRTREVLGAARLIFEALRARGNAEKAMVKGNVTHAVGFAKSANIALEVPGDIRLSLLGTVRDQMRTIPEVLSSEIDATIKRMIESHSEFNEHHTADIIVAYISLQVTEEKPLRQATFSKIATSLALRFSDCAIRFIKQANSADNMRNFAALVCSSVMKTVQTVKMCTSSNSQLHGGIGPSLEFAIVDIWHLARQVTVDIIMGFRACDCTKFLIFLDTAGALHSLDATRKFVMGCGSSGLEIDAFKHHQHVLTLVCMPLLNMSRIELFDSLHQMLLYETWLLCAVNGGFDDPRETLNGGINIYRTGSEPAMQKKMMKCDLSGHVGLVSALDGDIGYETKTMSTLIATRAIVHSIQRVTLKLVRAAILSDGVAFNVLQIIFGLFEIYLAAVAAGYFPDVDVAPPSSSASVQLSALVASIRRKAVEDASALNSFHETVVAAESMLYAGETILNTATAILPYETRFNKHISAKARLHMYAKTANGLRAYTFRVVGSSLVDAHDIAKTISRLDSAVWFSSILREECNSYVYNIIRKLSSLWASLDDKDNDVLFNHDVKELIWTHAVQATFEAFVDGFAMVGMCSTAGRALMSMDLHVLQFSLENVHRASPARGAALVPGLHKIRTIIASST